MVTGEHLARIGHKILGVAVILYHHVAKTGGTSITSWLQENVQPSCSPNWYPRHTKEKQDSIRLIAGHHASEVIDMLGPGWIKTTIIREPFDRLVCFYLYERSRIGDRCPSLRDFVNRAPWLIQYANIGLDRFDIIGVYPRVQEFCDAISRATGIPRFDGRVMNKNHEKGKLSQDDLEFLGSESLLDLLWPDCQEYMKYRNGRYGLGDIFVAGQQ